MAKVSTWGPHEQDVERLCKNNTLKHTARIGGAMNACPHNEASSGHRLAAIFLEPDFREFCRLNCIHKQQQNVRGAKLGVRAEMGE